MLGYSDLREEPLISSPRRGHRSLPIVVACIVAACLVFFAGHRWGAAPGRSSGDHPGTAAPGADKPDQRLGGATEAIEISFAVDLIREVAQRVVDSLDMAEHKSKVYYPDAAAQLRQWQICTIVQQCLVPDFGLAVGNLTAKTRAHVFEMLALALSGEAYKLILVQSMSNLLLGEMQNWAVQCPGHCDRLDDESGLLPGHMLVGESGDPVATTRVDLSFADCKAAADAAVKAKTPIRHMWTCDEGPRMVHHANMDTQTGAHRRTAAPPRRCVRPQASAPLKASLAPQAGTGWATSSPSPRSTRATTSSTLSPCTPPPPPPARPNAPAPPPPPHPPPPLAPPFPSTSYGSLKPGEPFGFRYSGHHFDLSFRFDGSGGVSDLPVFLGHNPLMVPRQSPPQNAKHEDCAPRAPRVTA